MRGIWGGGGGAIHNHLKTKLEPKAQKAKSRVTLQARTTLFDLTMHNSLPANTNQNRPTS